MTSSVSGSTACMSFERKKASLRRFIEAVAPAFQQREAA